MTKLQKDTIKAFEITINKYENMQEIEHWFIAHYCAFCQLYIFKTSNCHDCPISINGKKWSCLDSDNQKEFCDLHSLGLITKVKLKPFALRRAKELKKLLKNYKKSINDNNN